MRRFLFVLALFLIAAGFMFAGPVVDIGESPPVGVICTAVEKSAEIIIMPMFFEQAVINNSTINIIFEFQEDCWLNKDYIIYNLQRHVESETIFAYY